MYSLLNQYFRHLIKKEAGLPNIREICQLTEIIKIKLAKILLYKSSIIRRFYVVIKKKYIYEYD